MTLTAFIPRLSDSAARGRERSRWSAAIWAVAGNILVIGIIASAVAATVGAAVLVFGAELMAQL